MRGQPDHGMAQLLAGSAWSDASEHDVPEAWRPLLDLDDERLLDESDRIESFPAAPGPAEGDPSSPLAAALDVELEALRELGAFEDVTDLVIDVSDVAADPFGEDVFPVPEPASSELDPEPADVAVAPLADPFDADHPAGPFGDDATAGDPIENEVAPPGDDALESDDGLADDITDDVTDVIADDITDDATLDRTVGVEHHDPFDVLDDGSGDAPAPIVGAPSDDPFDDPFDEAVVDVTIDPVEFPHVDDHLDDRTDVDVDGADDDLDEPFGDDA